MKRLALPAIMILSSCGTAEVPAPQTAPRATVITSETGTPRDPAASILKQRQVRVRLRFNRVGHPQVTQKQIDACLGSEYSLIVDRVARSRDRQPEIHTLYLRIPKSAVPADLAARLETLGGVQEVRLR